MSALSIEDCLATAARLLEEAEMEAISNPARSEALTAMAAEWRLLAEALVEAAR